MTAEELNRIRARYPLAGAQDLYKAVFQALAGPGHAVADAGLAARRLAAEVAGAPVRHAQPLPGEVEFEELSDRSDFIRVNLRPYTARGGSVPALAAIFYESAAQPTAVRDLEHCLQALAKRWRDDDSAVWSAYIDAARRGTPVVVRHTAAYHDAYRPAYRVVSRRLVGR